MANNTLRMSGLNSGLDTEAIVNALTAATKNKINKNQRSILTLQAQQDAYRTIIDKFNAFKNKYFDMLNIGTCLKSKSLFSSFKSTLTSSTGTNFVPGVTVTSSSTANTGTYDVTVNKVATQSTYKSSNETGKAADFSKCRNEDEEYTMKVAVGSKSVYVTFKGGSDEQIREQINGQLADAFGKTNDGKGIVSIGTDNKFVSTDKASVVTTKPALYANQQSRKLENLETGNNSFTITVNGVTKTVSFSTLSEDYFDDIFDDSGKLKAEEELDDEGKTKLALYKQVVLNQREGEVYESYEAWWEGLSDEEKKEFAETIAKNEYNSNKEDIENSYNDAVKAKMQLKAYNEYLEGLEEGEEAMDFGDYVETLHFTSEDIESFTKNDEDGIALTEQYNENMSKLDEMYNGYTDQVKQKEINASYNEYFDKAKEAAYNQALADGTIQNTDEEGENYVASWEDYTGFTKADFEAYTEETDSEGNATRTYTNQFYKQHLEAAEDIEDKYSQLAEEGYHSLDLDRLSSSQKAAFYDKYYYSKIDGQTAEDYINNFSGQDGLTAAQEAVYQFNKANIENNLEALSFGGNGGYSELHVEYGRDGSLTIKGVFQERGVDDEGNMTWTERDQQFAITSNAGSVNDFGFDTTDVSGTASQISTTSKLSELGLEPDEDGNYSFSINGVSFTFSGDTTVSDMMKKVSASDAGVTMTYTTLTNQFILTAKEYGTGVDIDFQDGGQGLLSALGFGASREEGIGKFEEGHNTSLTINGVDVETTSNSYTVDGTTFTFTQAAVGQSFTNEVSRDYSKAMDTIKSFVEDYNKLIDDIYGYVDEEPNKDYYFLTDDDIDEMGLSETQQAKWEKMASKGLLYRDSTLTDIMSKLRTILYNSVDAADGSKVGLYTLGITTSSDYSNHGKLIFDDTKDFEAIFEKYADEFTELFTNTEKGIAYQLEKVIDNATRTTGGPGERGSLVDKAGVAGTASATSNALYNKIKSLQDMIASLQRRYEQQQDRYWKIYGNMETMMGNLNGQTSYINQLLGNF